MANEYFILISYVSETTKHFFGLLRARGSSYFSEEPLPDGITEPIRAVLTVGKIWLMESGNAVQLQLRVSRGFAPLSTRK